MGLICDVISDRIKSRVAYRTFGGVNDPNTIDIAPLKPFLLGRAANFCRNPRIPFLELKNHDIVKMSQCPGLLCTIHSTESSSNELFPPCRRCWQLVNTTRFTTACNAGHTRSWSRSTRSCSSYSSFSNSSHFSYFSPYHPKVTLVLDLNPCLFPFRPSNYLALTLA